MCDLRLANPPYSRRGDEKISTFTGKKTKDPRIPYSRVYSARSASGSYSLSTSDLRTTFCWCKSLMFFISGALGGVYVTLYLQEYRIPATGIWQPLPPMHIFVGKRCTTFVWLSSATPQHRGLRSHVTRCLSPRRKVVGAFETFTAPFSGRTYDPASISRSRCPCEKSTSVSFRTALRASCPPRPAEGVHQSSKAGWHAKEREARVLCQEKSATFRKLRGLEPKLGKKGWIEACRASSATANAPCELLLGLLLQPQLTGQLSRQG